MPVYGGAQAPGAVHPGLTVVGASGALGKIVEVFSNENGTGTASVFRFAVQRYTGGVTPTDKTEKASTRSPASQVKIESWGTVPTTSGNPLIWVFAGPAGQMAAKRWKAPSPAAQIVVYDTEIMGLDINGGASNFGYSVLHTEDDRGSGRRFNRRPRTGAYHFQAQSGRVQQPLSTRPSSGMLWNNWCAKVPIPRHRRRSDWMEAFGGAAGPTTFNQTLAVTGTWTGAITKSTGKGLAVTGTWTAALIRSVGKILAVTGTWTAALIRSTGKKLAVTGTWTAAMLRTAGKVLAVSGTWTAAMIRQTGKKLAVAATFTAAMIWQTGKKLAASGTWTAALTGIKVILKTLAVTATYTVAMTRRVGKTLAATGTWAVGLTKRIGKLLGAVGSWVANLVTLGGPTGVQAFVALRDQANIPVSLLDRSSGALLMTDRENVPVTLEEGPAYPTQLTEVSPITILEPVLSIEGSDFLLNGVPWYPRGFNCRGLLAPQWYSDGGGDSDISRARFSTETRDLWRSKGAQLLRWQISQVGIMDPGHTDAERAAYLSYVVNGIRQVRSEGFICIVSCQDQAGGGGPAASTPSARTITFWQILAPQFMTDPGIMFEAFNEPQTNSGQQDKWRNGGGLNNLSETRVGHQALLDTIRGTGASNIVIVDGNSFGHTLEGTMELDDPLGRVAYAIHPYNYDSLGSPGAWLDPYAIPPVPAPIVATEWQFSTGNCGTTKETLANPLLQFLQAHNIGVLAHAGDTDAIFADFVTGTPTECGTDNEGCGAIFLDWMAAL